MVQKVIAGTGVAAPPQADMAAIPGPVVPSADELVGSVARAQGLLAKAATEGPFARDPYRFALAALSDHLGVLLKTTRRWEAATAAVVAAQHPLSAEERAAVTASAGDGAKAGAVLGMREEAKRLIRRMDHNAAVRAGLTVGGAYVGGALTVLGLFMTMHLGPFSAQSAVDGAWREVVQQNPDPRTALASAEVKADRATGRRYYAGVSLWLDPPRQPPASAAK